MDEQLIKSVEDLGLSQKEARVYLANLSLGPATVQQIADQSGIKRVTTYVILEALASLGLVSQSAQGRKTFFNAEDPVALRRLLEKKQEEIKEQRQHFDDLLPQLSTLKSLPKDAPNVKFYDSAEGIRSIMSSFLASQKDTGDNILYGISNIDQVYAFFPEIQANQSNPARVKAGLKSKLIYTSAEGPIFKDTDKKMGRESRYLPLDKYPLNGDVDIWGDHIVMLSLTGPRPIGITIQSKELAKSLRALFDLAWEASKKYN